MDKASIAIDLGFHVEKTGSVYNVVPHPFASVEEVHDFPWNISLQGSRAQRELGWVKEWIEQASVHQGGRMLWTSDSSSVYFGSRKLHPNGS